MTRLRGLALTIGVLVGFGSHSPSWAEVLNPLGAKFEIERRVLPNGLTEIWNHDAKAKVVALQTWVRAGSLDEKPGKSGLAHFFEHLMFKGTEKNGPKVFFRELESRGVELNAFTTQDYTVYHEVMAPEFLERVLELEADRLQGLVLSRELFETERKVIIEERKMRVENSPQGRTLEALWAQAFRVHPYRNPVIGWPLDLMNLELADLQDFYKKFYVPANVALVLTGNFDVEKTWQWIQKYYGPLKGGDRPERKIPVEPEPEMERRVKLNGPTATPQVSWAYRVTSAKDQDSAALDVLSNILFQGRSARAYRKLVLERKLALQVSGMALTPTEPGLFFVHAVSTSTAKVQEIEAELELLIREIQQKGVTAAEVEGAVRQLTAQALRMLRTPQGRAQWMGATETVLGDVRLWEKDLERYRKVTPADVQRVSQQYLIGNRRSAVTLNPEGTP
jgi:zinc protease